MKQIRKEDLVPMDAPGDGWHHIESNEEHPAQRRSAAADGSGVSSEIVQVLDNAAMAAIVAAGVPEEGLPVDVEHRGVPGVAAVPDTAAAGWVRELAVFDDGAGHLQLAARIEWTPPGLPGAWGALRVELTLTNPVYAVRIRFHRQQTGGHHGTIHCGLGHGGRADPRACFLHGRGEQCVHCPGFQGCGTGYCRR